MVRLFSYLLDFIFPKTCTLCRKQGSFLCTSCIHSLQRVYSSPSTDVFVLFNAKDRKIQKIIQKKEALYILGAYMFEVFHEALLGLRMYQNFTNVSVHKGNGNSALYTGFKSMDIHHLYSYIQNTDNVLYIHETLPSVIPQNNKRTIHLCLTN